jgi:hypothetical protein
MRLAPQPWGEIITSVLLSHLEADSTDPRQRQSRAFSRNRTIEWPGRGLVIVNLFANRSNTPAQLRSLPKPVAVGPLNDRILQTITGACSLSVAAWGNDGAIHGRSREVRALLPTLRCLTGPDGSPLTQQGEPFHPSRRAKDGWLVPLP